MTNEVPFYHDTETFWSVVSQSSQTVINQTDSVTQTEKANDGIDVYSQTENSQNVHPFLYKFYVECRNLQRKGTCDCCVYYCEPCKVEAHQPDDEWLLLVNKSLN